MEIKNKENSEATSECSPEESISFPQSTKLQDTKWILNNRRN